MTLLLAHGASYDRHRSVSLTLDHQQQRSEEGESQWHTSLSEKKTRVTSIFTMTTTALVSLLSLSTDIHSAALHGRNRSRCFWLLVTESSPMTAGDSEGLASLRRVTTTTLSPKTCTK